MEFLLEAGLILSTAPRDIAHFLLQTEGLSKAMIGEYLGEGYVLCFTCLSIELLIFFSDEANIAIMHAFVDQLDFTDMPFTDALRLFLQSFRLPGEAQKIDRLMLKFAERYTANNPTVYNNAGMSRCIDYFSHAILNQISRHGLCSGLLCYFVEHGRLQSSGQTSNDKE